MQFRRSDGVEQRTENTSGGALISPSRLFAKVRGNLPGPKSQALRAKEAPYLAPGTQSIMQLAGVAMARGEGALLEDVDGNTYIDFVAGICVASIGHGHPALAKALSEQALRLSAGSFTTEDRVELLQRIANVAPAPHLRRTQLYSGGAEAVESALRLARAHTKKFEVISFWGGFHGKTAGVLGLMGSDFKHGLGPLPPGQILSPYPDCYRCPFKMQPDSCGMHCIDFLRQTVKYQSTGSIAAIIVEPIQGTAGNVLPPPGWLEALRKFADELGALLILDEMITGWGRTGKMWGQQHYSVRADIMTFGKGVGSGFPITGLVSSDDIVRAEPWSKPSFSSSSYGGGPLAAAAANAVTRVIVEEKLDENAEKVGAALLAALKPFQERFDFVGDVRGKGLLIGIDLVTDKKTREPLPKAQCEWIFTECLRRGLLSMSYAPRLRINPPLVITREQALEGAAILEEVFTAFSRKTTELIS